MKVHCLWGMEVDVSGGTDEPAQVTARCELTADGRLEIAIGNHITLRLNRHELLSVLEALVKGSPG